MILSQDSEAYLQVKEPESKEWQMVMNCLNELPTPQPRKDYSIYLEDIDALRINFGLDLGWHYPLDIIWILMNVTLPLVGIVIFDSGAIKGLLQYAIGEKAYQLVRMDFSDHRFQLPIRLAFPLKHLKSIQTTGECLNHMTSKYSGELPENTDKLITLRRAILKARRLLVALSRLPFPIFKRNRQIAGCVAR